MTDYATMRAHMVEGQILPSKVTDPRLIGALYEVPREQFVTPGRRSVAYVDEDLEMAPGRFIMEPVVLARLLQAAAPGPDDVALDIGCGTGYATALLARLAGTAVGIESDANLATRAGEILTTLEIDNAVVVERPLADGYAEQAPYDVILLDGAVAEVPQAIVAQLAEGGRMLAVIDPGGGLGAATLFVRVGGVIGHRTIFDAAVEPLPGFAARPRFAF
jgi:protein-L-isoaspartate(D-aspartate) O-methyltransferase